MKKRDIPKDILERVENELLVDERLLWLGLPYQSSMLERILKPISFGFASFFVVALFSFLIIARAGGNLSNLNLSSLVILAPAILIAIIFSLLVALAQHYQSRANLYAVTNRRAIILRRKRVQSFGAADLQFIERKMNRDGSGDIIFKRDYYESQAAGFFGIQNPAEVEALMLETFRAKETDKRRLLDEQDDNYYDDYQDNFQQAKQN